jgi:hypothetical protein
MWSDEKWQRIGAILGVDLTQPRTSAEDERPTDERDGPALGRAA